MCRTRSIGTSGGVSLIAAMMVWASSKIDVPGDREAEQAPLLLAMDHRDDTRAMRPFNRPDRLGASDGIPSPHEEGLQSHDEKEDPKQ